MSSQSFLARVYKKWFVKDGEMPHMLSACIFYFAVIVRAPVRWFFQKQYASTWLRPWTVTLGVLFIVFLFASSVLREVIAILPLAIIGVVVAAIVYWALMEGMFIVLPKVWTFLKEDVGLAAFFDATGTVLKNVLGMKVLGTVPFWTIIPLGLAMALGIHSPDTLVLLMSVAFGYIAILAIGQAFFARGTELFVPRDQEVPSVADNVGGYFALASEYMSAVRSKICPTITFVDEDVKKEKDEE